MTAKEKTDTLNVVKQMVADGQVSQEVAERYFPELKDSADERLRKALIQRLEQSLKGAEEQAAAGCDRTETIEAYEWGLSLLHKMKKGENMQPVQWKPTAAQMYALKEKVNEGIYSGRCSELSSLYHDLIKLL